MKRKILFSVILFASVSILVHINANAQGRIELTRTSNAGATLNSSSEQGFNTTFSFNSIESEPVSNDKGEFSEIFIDGAFPNGEVGAPQLPMITRLIAIPDGATPVVSLGNYSETEYTLSDYGIGKVSARQAPIRKNIDPSTVEYKVSNAAYTRNSYNDDAIASVEVIGTMRGITIGRLIVQPVRYNPAAGTVKVFNDINIKVKFQNGDAATTAETFSNTFSPAFNSVYEQIFNIDMLMGGKGSKDAYTDHPDMYNTPVKMLVICYSGFKNNNSLKSWLQWKLQKGYYVDIFYTDETGTSSSNIKSFIKTKYNASVSAGNAYTYLIIIGDTDQVPQYMTKNVDENCASDLGYSSVNFTTSSTSNYFPDMYYSRMSVENTTQLSNYINKVLTYEKYEFTDNGDYLNNVILVGGWDSNWTSRVAKPTINYATNNYFNTSSTIYGGFENGTIKATISTSSTSGYSGSNNGAYQGINNGACFVNYTAHGDKQEWYQPKLTAKQVASLTNSGKYFFAVGNCCLTGNFNNTSTDYSPGSSIGTDACFAEAMIRVPNAGAIAYVGCSPYSYWYEDFYWAVGAHSYSAGNTPSVSGSSKGVYDIMFTDEYWNSASSLLYLGNLAVQQAVSSNYTTSGITDGNCKNSAHYYFQFYHTFGDGSVMPFITKPEVNSVTIPETVEPGSKSITVNAVAGSYVAVTDNSSVIYGVGVANTSGVATVEFTEEIPNSGKIYVVVTRQQYQPYFGTINIEVSSSISVKATATPSIIALGSSSTLNATATGGTTYTYSWMPAGSLNNANIQQPTATPTETTNYKATVTSNGESGYAYVSVQVVTPPTNLTATSVNCGSGTKLTWTAPSLVSSYNIYRNSNLIASNVTETEYTDSNLSIGTYNYQVAAVYENAEAKCDAVSLTLEGASGPCECDVIFSLRDSYGDGWNGATLTVSFDDGTVSQTLELPKSYYYSISNKCDTLKVYTLSINHDTGVTVVFNGGDYDSECSVNIAYVDGDVIYSCKAGDLKNQSNKTIATFTTDCGSAPITECYAPTNLGATAGSSSITLTWTASSTASSYNVYRDGALLASNITGTSYTDNTAAEGITYSYTVKSICSNGGVSEDSNSASASISSGGDCEDVTYEFSTKACDSYTWRNGVTYTSSVSGVTYTVPNATADGCDSIIVLHLTLGTGTADISITAEAGTEEPYTVTLTAEGAETYIWSTGETTQSITISPTETTVYTVTGTDAFGCKGSAEYTVHIDGIAKTSNEVCVYPNPTKDLVSIKAERIEHVRICNMLGQTINETKTNGNTVQIDMSGLAHGQYYMQITTSNGIVTKKLVKQ